MRILLYAPRIEDSITIVSALTFYRSLPLFVHHIHKLKKKKIIIYACVSHFRYLPPNNPNTKALCTCICCSHINLYLNEYIYICINVYNMQCGMSWRKKTRNFLRRMRKPRVKTTECPRKKQAKWYRRWSQIPLKVQATTN